MKKLMTMLIGLLALCACSNDLDKPVPVPGPDPAPLPAPGKNERKDIPLSDLEARMVLQGNDFAYHLFRRVDSLQKEPANLLMSPLSVGYALSMLNNGAAGQTQQEISKVLGYKDCSLEDINVLNRKMLIASAKLDRQVSLQTANVAFLRQGMPVIPDFRNLCKQYYNAEVATVDFSSPQALGLINGWVSDHTGGRIPSMLDKVDANAAFYLLNAMDFKGEWSTPFEKSDTKEETFTNADGTTSTVPMMHRTFNSLCFVGDTYTMLPVSYGNAAFSFYILLPLKGETTGSVIAGLSETSWATLFKNRGGYRVHLKLPRFKSSSQINMNEALEALGITSAFDGTKADFSRLTPTPVFISKVLQKSGIAVDEEGTVAESSTVIEGTVASPGPIELPDLDFFADRPFVYMIRETSTGAIFFIGEINKL